MSLFLLFFRMCACIKTAVYILYTRCTEKLARQTSHKQMWSLVVKFNSMVVTAHLTRWFWETTTFLFCVWLLFIHLFHYKHWGLVVVFLFISLSALFVLKAQVHFLLHNCELNPISFNCNRYIKCFQKRFFLDVDKINSHIFIVNLFSYS